MAVPLTLCFPLNRMVPHDLFKEGLVKIKSCCWVVFCETDLIVRIIHTSCALLSQCNILCKRSHLMYMTHVWPWAQGHSQHTQGCFLISLVFVKLLRMCQQCKLSLWSYEAKWMQPDSHNSRVKALESLFHYIWLNCAWFTGCLVWVL